MSPQCGSRRPRGLAAIGPRCPLRPDKPAADVSDPSLVLPGLQRRNVAERPRLDAKLLLLCSEENDRNPPFVAVPADGSGLFVDLAVHSALAADTAVPQINAADGKPRGSGGLIRARLHLELAVKQIEAANQTLRDSCRESAVFQAHLANAQAFRDSERAGARGLSLTRGWRRWRRGTGA